MKQLLLLLSIAIATTSFAQLTASAPTATVDNGTLQGSAESGIKIFKGVPYAPPPVGNLRWREPQPAANWSGTRQATRFGPRAMQLPIFSDMVFRSDGVSEDCLYLNVWTPANTTTDKLPVLVYFFGGGFRAGDGSEYRYDGESMARHGIVSITVNFRLGVFGFLAHPELTSESPHHASGNYGLLDQAAALLWVQKNVAAFGGDPKRITIAGESAGSYSVSAQMASPLAKATVAGAIGESGSLLGNNVPPALKEAEQNGSLFAQSMGVKTLAELRAMSAQQVLEASEKRGAPRSGVCVDGYFFPEPPLAIYTAGRQAKVPLMAGWNSAEAGYQSVLGQEAPTVANFEKAVQKQYGSKAADALKAYAAATDADVKRVATQLASDQFIAYGTWKWTDLQSKTSPKPVYRYLYERARPITNKRMAQLLLNNEATMTDSLQAALQTVAANGASHSAEIEYALGNLPTNRVYAWQPDDFKVAQIMQGYFVNFIKTGNPNGLALPAWPAVQPAGTAPVLHIDVLTRVEPEAGKAGYLFFDGLRQK